MGWTTRLGLLLAVATASALGEPLLLDAVLRSTEQSHPLILAQITKRAMAEGKLLSARGAFDLDLKASARTNSFGYYKTRSGGAGMSQPIRRLGGEVYGGYKLGLGNFEPWNGNLLTLSRGEWSGGLLLPLLRDRAVDGGRADLQIAQLSVDLADASIEERRLALLRGASLSYWRWVSAGSKLMVAEALLELAVNRTEQVQQLVDAGQVAEIEITENERAVLRRRSSLVSAERSLQAARFDLSLYLRDASGSPRQAGRDELPDFPEPESLSESQVQIDELAALRRRPEVTTLVVGLSQNGVEARLARNDLRPSVSLRAQFGRDGGVGSITKRGPEFIAGIAIESPAQRRKAKGQIAVVDARQRQLLNELQFVRDRVAVEIRDAVSALTLAQERLRLARSEVSVALRLAEAEEERFELGDSTLFVVNQRETAAAAAELETIDALTECHAAVALYRASIAAL